LVADVFESLDEIIAEPISELEAGRLIAFYDMLLRFRSVVDEDAWPVYGLDADIDGIYLSALGRNRVASGA
jgi:hypothetical protein